MKLITLYLPVPYLEQLDELVRANVYPNRAEAIRIAVRDLLNSSELAYYRALTNHRKILEAAPKFANP